MAGRTESISCSFEIKNTTCTLFAACSDAHNANNGDLTPTQFCGKHPKFKIDQIVRVREIQKKLTPENEMPLDSIDKIVSKHSYIIPGTVVCILEGEDGRAKTCPNNSARNPKEHTLKDLCEKCLDYPSTASVPNDGISKEYLAIRHQHRRERAQKIV
jgi:hypothetical protein